MTLLLMPKMPVFLCGQCQAPDDAQMLHDVLMNAHWARHVQGRSMGRSAGCPTLEYSGNWWHFLPEGSTMRHLELTRTGIKRAVAQVPSPDGDGQVPVLMKHTVCLHELGA